MNSRGGMFVRSCVSRVVRLLLQTFHLSWIILSAVGFIAGQTGMCLSSSRHPLILPTMTTTMTIALGRDDVECHDRSYTIQQSVTLNNTVQYN